MEYFQDATTQCFTFTSYASGVTETTFAVLRFKGMEAISTPYEFEVMLVSGDPDVDLSALLQSQAVFTIHRDKGEDIAYNGILAEFDQLHAYNDHYFYRAKLVPKIWWLMQTQHNQVFLDKSVPEIIEGALVDGGMDSLDYDVSALEGTYNPVEYVCQYGESHFNFVSRWLEREGVYYYFYHDIDGDKLVLSDSSFSHEPFRQGADLVYSPKTGMEQGHLDELILNFTCRQKQLPNRIVLKDHNPERPSLEMSVRADVDPNGRGESFLYGEHYATPEEGERLVAFRAEELLCQKQEFHGDSTVPFLSPGFKFNMNRHYRSAFNQEYMVTSVTHEGDQTNLLKTSVIGSLTENAEINIYSNSFTAIPADRQYRHTRTAERPRISGTLHGKIDGEQESPYAQLDEQGRYKVKLPFDINDEHIDGKASARVRMMQPYAGEGKGMQFPLTKGTEVLLTFIDGNPDRPVIAGAISSEVAPSPVSAGNQSESVIRSAGNNRIRMEDKAGAERIMFESPSSNSWLRVGAPNDPISLSGSSIAYVKTGEIWGSDSAPDQMGHGIQEDGSTYDPTPISIDWIRKQSEVDSNSATDYQGKALDDEGEYIVQYVHTGAEENAASNTARRRLFVFDTDDSEHPYYKKVTDGIRLFSNGSVWIESMDRYGLYTDGYPDYYNKAGGTDQGRAYIGTLLNKLENDYAPSGLKNYHDGTALGAGKSIKQLMPTAQVNVSSFDTITTQEGNIYDFGGYWNYNLGNSYEEAHINQSAELNSLDKVDILNEAGPNWAGVSWPSTTGGTGIGSSNIAAEDTTLSANWSSGDVWTTKQFGNSYDLHVGDAISIHDGDSLDISFKGHRNIELVLRKDESDNPSKPAYYSHSESGVNKERKWDKQGQLIYDSTSTDSGHSLDTVETHYNRGTSGVKSFSAVSTTGMGTAEFEFDFSNVASAKVSVGTSLKFTMDAAVSAAVAVNLSASFSLSLNPAVALDIKANGLGVEMDLIANKQKVSFPGGSVKNYTGRVLDVQNKALVEIKNGHIILKNEQGVRIKKGNFNLDLVNLDMKG